MVPKQETIIIKYDDIGTRMDDELWISVKTDAQEAATMLPYTKRINYTSTTFTDEFLRITNKLMQFAQIGNNAECIVYVNQ